MSFSRIGIFCLTRHGTNLCFTKPIFIAPSNASNLGVFRFEKRDKSAVSSSAFRHIEKQGRIDQSFLKTHFF